MPTLKVDLVLRDADPQELDQLTVQLRRELLTLDVEDVVRAGAGVAPAGAKGDPATIGSLIVGLGSSAVATALITGVCQIVREWVGRRRDRSVVLELEGRRLELTGASAEQQQAAVDTFLAAIAEEGQPDGEHGRDS